MYSRAAATYAKTPIMFGGKQRECTPLHNKGRAMFPGLEHPEGLEPRMLLDERSSDTVSPHEAVVISDHIRVVR